MTTKALLEEIETRLVSESAEAHDWWCGAAKSVRLEYAEIAEREGLDAAVAALIDAAQPDNDSE